MKLVRLGPTRLKVLRLVLQGRQRGLPPTLRELAQATGRNFGAVQCHLAALRKLGLVQWEDYRTRTLHSRYVFVPAEEL